MPRWLFHLMLLLLSLLCFYILIFRKTHTTNLCDAACRLALLDLHWRRRRQRWWLQSRGCVFFILFVSALGVVVGGARERTNEHGKSHSLTECEIQNKKNTDCDVVKKQTLFPLSLQQNPTPARQLTTANCVIILFAKNKVK